MTGSVAPYTGHALKGTCRWLHLEPDDLLCRVWDRESGAAHGFDACDWNPNRKQATDTTAGRFDPLPHPTNTSGFLYGSKSGADERVAILETFRSLMFRDHGRSGRNVVPRAERDRRSVRLFRLYEPVSLVDLNAQAGRECFRMDEEVIYVHDRPATRTWGDAVRDMVDDAAGIAFNSTRESLSTGLPSFMLWEDRAPNDRFQVVHDIPLGSAEGRAMVDAALQDYEVFWA